MSGRCTNAPRQRIAQTPPQRTHREVVLALLRALPQVRVGARNDAHVFELQVGVLLERVLAVLLLLALLRALPLLDGPTRGSRIADTMRRRCRASERGMILQQL